MSIRPPARSARRDECRGHRIDHVRVELAITGTATQFLQGLFLRARLAVGALIDHRVKGVTGADDPRSQGDLISGETIRVARAVVALVAGADELPDDRQ